jgi:alpha-beta hydrolase superfamily lysophospholipase
MTRRTRKPERAGRRRRRWIGVSFVVLALFQLFVALEGPRIVGDTVESSGLAAFYQQPVGADVGAPGTLVKSEPLVGAPFLSRAWRIMYRSTDLRGAPIVVTGIVVTPLGIAPSGGRTVLVWGHPTTGTATSCAPSRSFDPFIGIEGLRLMLTRGYTVVAPDFAGMGTAGPNSYLVGDTAAHTVLDAVRAARQIPAAETSKRVIMWGHSQGGQAVLFAAQDAATYAPELKIIAVAAAAPAANLTVLVGAHLNDISGVTIGSYAFPAFGEVYGPSTPGAKLNGVLTAGAIRNLPEMNRLCLLPSLSELHTIGTPLIGHFFLSDPSTTQPWARLLKENSAGATAIAAPVFIAQGRSDTLVPPTSTANFVKHERQLGMNVTYNPVPLANHGTIAYLTLPALNSWLDRVTR